MIRKCVLLAGLFISNYSFAGCPQFFDNDMRKLHSQEQVNFCELQDGKPMLIINTASHCGYTKQFKGLEKLHKKYRDDGLVVVGFASDDFRQEAKDEEKAAEVCYVNYGVTFTMIAPSHVRGDNANPIFAELVKQSGKPNWNFNKYLVDRNGKVVEHFGSGVAPEDRKLTASIERVL